MELELQRISIHFQKHHYHELSADVQRVLGTVPCDFTKYWILKFPHLLSHSYHAMEPCSKESIFKRYYTPQFVFTKPDYLFDESFDNFELQEAHDNSRLMYNKSPKKENRQPNGVNGNAFNKLEKSKRGSYNFNNKNQAPNAAFITRDDMVKVPEARRKKSLAEEKLVWTLPK